MQGINKYKSASQRVRVISELWMQNEMFCPACGCNHLVKMPNNTKVADFACNFCGEIYELKSTGSAIGKKILDGAYYTALERINSSTNPNLFVLRYYEYNIIDLTLIPKYFFTPDILQRRNALSQNARRAGYIGSFILYDKIPVQGKISVIKSCSELDRELVIESYKKSAKFKVNKITSRGWLMDILSCVNKLNCDIFSVNDLYASEYDLWKKHPDNHNIRAKIRQQLQFLRDRGFIKFLGNGIYQKI